MLCAVRAQADTLVEAYRDIEGDITRVAKVGLPALLGCLESTFVCHTVVSSNTSDSDRQFGEDHHGTARHARHQCHVGDRNRNSSTSRAHAHAHAHAHAQAQAHTHADIQHRERQSLENRLKA